jgi:hypothetical protein
MRKREVDKRAVFHNGLIVHVSSTPQENAMPRIINKAECINCEAVCPVSCITEA